MWHNIYYMFAKSNSNVSIFWLSKRQNVKILQNVSRRERFSTPFQVILSFSLTELKLKNGPEDPYYH